MSRCHWRCRYRQIATFISTIAHKQNSHHTAPPLLPHQTCMLAYCSLYARRLAAFVRIVWSPWCDFPNGTHASGMCVSECLCMPSHRVSPTSKLFECEQQDSLSLGSSIVDFARFQPKIPHKIPPRHRTCK